MEKEVIAFFDIMVKHHINKDMLKYINMAKFRDDFISGTLKAIEEYKENRNKNDYADIKAVCNNVRFWFNKYENSDATRMEEDKINEFVINTCDNL